MFLSKAHYLSCFRNSQIRTFKRTPPTKQLQYQSIFIFREHHVDAVHIIKNSTYNENKGY